MHSHVSGLVVSVTLCPRTWRMELVMRGSGSGSENKIANREPFWEPDHAANLVQPRTCTENTSAVLSVKADLPDQSERLVEAYRSVSVS